MNSYNDMRRNQAGYMDLTAYDAITNIEGKIRREKAEKPYPRTYVCSPFAGDMEGNAKRAEQYCRFVLTKKKFPIAPHLLLPRFMDDTNPAERALALDFGIRLLKGCREIWVFGSRVSDGMAAEIQVAKRCGIKIRCFNENCEEVIR